MSLSNNHHNSMPNTPTAAQTNSPRGSSAGSVVAAAASATGVFRYSRQYFGPVKALVLDHAGTVVDCGCQASQASLIEVFASKNIALTNDDVRVSEAASNVQDKTQRKTVIRAILFGAAKARFQEVHHREPNEWDVEALFKEYVPSLCRQVSKFSVPIPGAAQTVQMALDRGLRVAFVTDLPKQAQDLMVSDLARHRIPCEAAVCADEVPAAQPQPWLCYEAMKKLGVFPANSVVRVTSSVHGVEAGLNAGAWVVAIAKTGWSLQLSQQELNEASSQVLNAKLQRITSNLYSAGAHVVINSIDQLPRALEQIEQRILMGVRP